jgi:hypothetical protein
MPPPPVLRSEVALPIGGRVVDWARRACHLPAVACADPLGMLPLLQLFCQERRGKERGGAAQGPWPAQKYEPAWRQGGPASAYCKGHRRRAELLLQKQDGLHLRLLCADG